MIDTEEEIDTLYATLTPLEQHLFTLAELVVDMLEENNTKPEQVRLLVQEAIAPKRLRAIKKGVET